MRLQALEQLRGWEVPHAAAGVWTSTGLRAEQGDTERSFRLASVTKLLTAYAIMIGVAEEAVNLDDEAGPPGATLRHLLAHTSGYGFESDAPIVAPPGARRIYSNRGFEEAARHLERETGMSFAQYLSEAVLQPLGMSATRLAGPLSVGPPPVGSEVQAPGSPAAGGVSTVRDLGLFAAELLAPKLMHHDTFQAMITVQFPGLSGVLPGHGRLDPLDWGLGVERAFTSPGHWAGTAVSSKSFGHFGRSGTFLWVDPVSALACVCLTDRDFGPWARLAWPALCDAIVTETRNAT